MAAIATDGVADEPEWQQAEVITGFTSVDPFTGEPAPYPVVARVLATPEGLAVWARAEVPPEIRSHGRSPRDAPRMDADPIRLMVDFEGEGHTAYEFTISMANSIRDGVLTKGRTAPTYDWDGIWFHGAHEDEQGWSAEWLIPWSSVPMSSGQGDHRVIGVWFAQFIKRMAHGYGYPAISSASPNFIDSMHKITVPRYSTARLDWFPYASVNSDRLKDRVLGRAGLDIAWKPEGPHQLTATVNPDFGQVESDDLVVNFSAIETFFSEKRPFFTENQGVFDLRLPDEGRLVNTRRIGGNPDAGALGASEIITAAKYTGIIDKLELGAFAALEDDSDAARGRRYFVGRGNYRGEKLSLGWLGSVTDRPTLDRTATVQSLDFEFNPRSSVSLRGQAIASLIDAPGAHDGLGMWLDYRNDPQLRLGQEYELVWFDRNLELNDLGYQPRRSLRQLRGTWDIYRRKLPDSSKLAFTRWELSARLAQNDFGQNLPAVFKLEREWRFRKPHGINFKFEYDTSGFDDLITRGGAAARVPSRYAASLFVTEQTSTRLRAEAEFKVFEEGVRGRAAVQSYLFLTYYLTPQVSTNIQATWLDSPDWFAFVPGINELASYRKRQWILRQGVSWFPSQKQELRARLQWVGLQADGRRAYDIAASGRLLPRATPATSFQRSELGFQLRYRYELKSLSDVFVVYTRGGVYGSSADDGFRDLWSGVNDTPNQDQFVVKLRYQFLERGVARRIQKWLTRILLGLLVLASAGYGLFKFENPSPQLREPNYYSYYLTQDRKPVGKVGVLVTELIMPEDNRRADYYNIALKSLQYIPWPFRHFAAADRGVVLLDNIRFYEFREFRPTQLIDLHGSERDVDGLRYMEKYRRGEVRWVPPDPRLHLDHGYFLLTSRKQGIPTIAAKLMTKATVYYYGRGLVQHKLPHEAGMKLIAASTMARIQEKYGEIPWRVATSDNFGILQDAIDELLDSGIDTLVIAPSVPIYSHHEEFNGSFRHAFEDVEAWEKTHGRKIKVILAPQLGDFPVLRQAYLNMLRDRLDTLPRGKDVDVKVAVSVHGMPWDFVPEEAWLKLAPPYRDAMLRDATVLLDSYDFGRKAVVLAQDHFADPVNNPQGHYLSTNKAFRDGIRDKFEYVINLPIEFFVENTDTLFSHAMFNFEGFRDFDRYAPIDYSDWSVPYTREFLEGGTHIIYNGLPVGKYSAPIIEAHFQAIDSVLARR